MRRSRENVGADATDVTIDTGDSDDHAEVVPIRHFTLNILTAAVPNPPEGAKLPGTVKELEAIASIVPPSCILSLPPEEDPLREPTAGITTATILKLLPKAVMLHLACHGQQNAVDPVESGFVLQDKKLTISDLLSLDLRHTLFAFLSACETAKGDEHNMNCSVHLAATLLFAGFKSVVGTIWCV